MSQLDTKDGNVLTSVLNYKNCRIFKCAGCHIYQDILKEDADDLIDVYTVVPGKKTEVYSYWYLSKYNYPSFVEFGGM